MRIFFKLKYAFLAVLSSILLITTDGPAASAPPCDMPDHPDYAPLMALYNATDGPNWNNSTGWGEDCDVCGWYGVSCLSNDRVHLVQLPRNDLKGNLPIEIGDLDSLKILRLRDNEISGDIPLELSNAKIIYELDLGGNDFTGNFPEVVFNLLNLKKLNLSFNDFTGNIPNNFQTSSQLEFFWVQINNLSGEIPSSLYDIKSLEEIHISGNSIAGILSPDIGKLSNLKELHINNTQIGGFIPPEIENAESLIELQIQNSNLEGSLPIELFNLENLENLDLRGNHITGGIDRNVNNLINIKILDLSNNNLSDTLPNNLSNLVNLQILKLGRNNFTGKIPTDIYSLSSLKTIEINNNNLVDSMSSAIANLSNLEGLNFSRNQLYGRIPDVIGTLEKLKLLYLHVNSFTGEYPESLGDMLSIQAMYINDNYLEGCYPASYQNLCSITSPLISSYCNFENPTFAEFCAGEPCNNTLNMSASNLSVCEGETVSMQPGSNYSNYQWSEPNQTSKTLTTTVTTSKYFYLTVTNSRGCTKTDSIFIHVTSTDPGAESAEICPGKTVEINGEVFDEIGFFQQLIPSPGSCDSIVNVTITQKEGTTGTYAETICPGTMTTINGQDFGVGESIQTIDNQAGCDSVISITISEYPTYETNLAYEVCEGGTYNFEGMELSVGLTTLELTSEFNCDSIINIDISEKSNSYETITGSFCSNSQVEINNEFFDVADTYIRTLTNNEGCDSVLTIIVTEKETSTGMVEATICEGDSVLIAGNYYKEGGTFNRALTNAVECDSFLNISITLLPSEITNLNEFICSEESFEIGTESFNTSGQYVVTLTNQFGCDSIINLNLNIISGEDQTINATTCEGSPYEFAGELYVHSITVMDSIVINGCKSLTTLNLEVIEPVSYEYDQFICEGNVQYFYGYFYDADTSLSVTLNTKSGCDSIVTMHLFVTENKVVTIDTFICEGSTLYFDNQFYDSPGTIEIPRKTSYGCDSLTYLNIDLYESETDTFYAEVCEGNTTEFFGDSYGVGEHAGTYDDGNCLQHFNLVISEVNKLRYDEVLFLCSGSQLQFMDEIYDQGGLYHLDEDVNDCEILEDLIVLEKSSSSLIIPQVFCAGSNFELGGEIIETSGIYPVSTNEGCTDKFVSILFVSGEKITIEETIQEGEGFEFGDVVYTDSGVYEITVGSEYGCSTIIELILLVEKCEGIRTEYRTLCAGESIQFYDQNISSSGIYEYHKPLEIGCDSIIQLDATFVPEVDFSIIGETFLCAGSETTLSGPEGYRYLWNNGAETSSIIISDGGKYELTIYNENNCATTAEIVVEEVRFPSEALGIIVEDPSTCEAVDGEISIDIEMTENYLYSIDGGATFQESNTFTQLSNGSYNIVLSDLLERCKKALETPVVIESDGVPQIKEINITPINDCNNQLGSIEIIPADAFENYQYSIDNGANWSEQGLFENLESGVYQVLLGEEGSLCINNLSSPIELENIGNLSAEIQVDENVSCAAASDGMASVQILQGEAPFNITWSNGGSSLIQNNLSVGNHEITITDANNCEQVLEIQLDAPDIEDVLSAFQDTIICTNETLVYEMDTSFNYILFKESEVYYEGRYPEISETGTYQIVIENGSSCVADKFIEVNEIDLSALGIDFLLSTEAVKGVEVIAVNVSDPMPDNFEWMYDSSGIKVNTIDPFSSGFTFEGSGDYEISILTEVNGCLARFDKTIVVYPDSSHLGTYEEPETAFDIDRFGSWKVFENPNNGQFNVEINVGTGKVPIRLAVYDIYGGLIENRTIRGKRKYLESFNLAGAGTGIYTVVLSAFGKQFSKNILIVK
ncbi:leucine-rich repeat domain-containing protein [Portibacter lacus]|uniref:Disease resistance R13L4/SHOC-2-like LRR domain-containing protein n=1 Tax=Portibacter lacus TaxID=1099794 RepID=A0AA37SNS5_9BACT|nr:hypothetical protein [Portibacter lacus]GLR17065.1 hypothetical protein GCM10007940_16800 [Portibacter lacus]